MTKTPSRKESRRRRELDYLREVVTDHALVRWLERVEGLNVDQIREHILADHIKAALVASDGHYLECQHPEGARVVCNTGKVVTIIVR